MMKALAPTLAFHVPDAFKSIYDWFWPGMPVEVKFGFASRPA